MAMPIVMAMGRVWSWVLGAAVYKIFTVLGVGFVVYNGVQALIEGVFTQINSSLTTGFIDGRVTQVFGMLRIDDAVAVLASAWSIKLTLLTAVGFKKLRFGGTSPAP